MPPLPEPQTLRGRTADPFFDVEQRASDFRRIPAIESGSHNRTAELEFTPQHFLPLGLFSLERCHAFGQQLARYDLAEAARGRSHTRVQIARC